MPGLCGSLNHSLERSLRLVTPVSGLFMISPAAHTPCLLCGIFLIGGDVYTPTGRPQRWRQAARLTTLIQGHQQEILLRPLRMKRAATEPSPQRLGVVFGR